MRPAIAALVCALALGCRATRYESTPTGSADQVQASVAAAQGRMHERYLSARTIVESIARGELDGARSAARVLVQIDDADVLPRWRPDIEGIAATAYEIQHAADLVGAARGAAILSVRCANCHAASKARIEFVTEPAPADGPSGTEQMRSHQWAATQMWQGLIAHADVPWRTGAVALIRAPISLAPQGGVPVVADDIDDVERVRFYGHRALAATSLGDRAELYGSLLATCAHCHSILKAR